jgi:hypothetical protein
MDVSRARLGSTSPARTASIIRDGGHVAVLGYRLERYRRGLLAADPVPGGITIGLDASNVATARSMTGSFTAVVVVPPDNLVSHSPWVLNATESPRAHHEPDPVERATDGLAQHVQRRYRRCRDRDGDQYEPADHEPETLHRRRAG